jgi:DNA-binding MarR family transcriptional regulator
MHPDAGAEKLAEIYTVVGPLYRRVQRKVERDEPGAGLSVGVRAVLDILRRSGPMTVPQLGREQDLSRQFVQRMVNLGVADGHLELVENPAHRRSSLVTMTDAGRAAIDQVTGHEHGLLRSVAAGLSEPDVDACLRVLRQLLAALERIED